MSVPIAKPMQLSVSGRAVGSMSLLIFVLVSCQSPYPPAEFTTAGYGLVYGRVLLPDSQPAAGARVRNDLSYANAAVADSAGQYRLALVAPSFGPSRAPIGLTFFAPVARDGIADSIETTVMVSLAASAEVGRDSSRLDVVLGAGAMPHGLDGCRVSAKRAMGGRMASWQRRRPRNDGPTIGSNRWVRRLPTA